MVNKGVIPRKLHFKEPNHSLKWESLPFEINTETITLPSERKLRTAAVSAFGFSGTNAHMIVQQIKSKYTEEKKKTRLFTVSAISKDLLLQDLLVYQTYISKTHKSLEDICNLTNQMRTGEKQLVQLYNQGANIDWSRIRNMQDCHIDLPPRTKKRKKCWY